MAWVTLAYSDTFPRSKRCHYMRAHLYSYRSQLFDIFWVVGDSGQVLIIHAFRLQQKLSQEQATRTHFEVPIHQLAMPSSYKYFTGCSNCAGPHLVWGCLLGHDSRQHCSKKQGGRRGCRIFVVSPWHVNMRISCTIASYPNFFAGIPLAVL